MRTYRVVARVCMATGHMLYQHQHRGTIMIQFHVSYLPLLTCVTVRNTKRKVT